MKIKILSSGMDDLMPCITPFMKDRLSVFTGSWVCVRT